MLGQPTGQIMVNKNHLKAYIHNVHTRRYSHYFTDNATDKFYKKLDTIQSKILCINFKNISVMYFKFKSLINYK